MTKERVGGLQPGPGVLGCEKSGAELSRVVMFQV